MVLRLLGWLAAALKRWPVGPRNYGAFIQDKLRHGKAMRNDQYGRTGRLLDALDQRPKADGEGPVLFYWTMVDTGETGVSLLVPAPEPLREVQPDGSIRMTFQN